MINSFTEFRRLTQNIGQWASVPRPEHKHHEHVIQRSGATGERGTDVMLIYASPPVPL